MADFQTPSTFQDPSQPKASLLEMLTKLTGGMMGGPSNGGGQPRPLISPGMVGQVPQMPGAPQVAGAGSGGNMPQMSMPGRMAAPGGSPSQNPSGTQTPPQSGLFQSGFEFNSPKGRDAAVTASAIQGVTQFISQAKQKRESKTRAQAEGYMSQI